MSCGGRCGSNGHSPGPRPDDLLPGISSNDIIRGVLVALVVSVLLSLWRS